MVWRLIHEKRCEKDDRALSDSNIIKLTEVFIKKFR